MYLWRYLPVSSRPDYGGDIPETRERVKVRVSACELRITDPGVLSDDDRASLKVILEYPVVEWTCDNWNGDGEIEFEAFNLRDETDEEYQARLDAIAKVKVDEEAHIRQLEREKEKRDRATYERLKAKYEAPTP